jgi:hypothetical protein
MSPMNPSAPGGAVTVRSGLNASPRARAASTAAIACSQASGDSDAWMSALDRVRTRTSGRSRKYGRTERCDWWMPGKDAGPDV